MSTTAPAAERYNLDESNYLTDPEQYHTAMREAEDITLAELAARGGRITRVRILAGRWGATWKADISYIHGVVGGQPVHVTGYPATDDLYGPRGIKADLITWAREQGVFAKGLGLLDESNWSVLKG